MIDDGSMGWQATLLWASLVVVTAVVLFIVLAKRRERMESHWRRKAASGWQNTDFRDSLQRWHGNNATAHNSRIHRSSSKWSLLP